uniref:Uncharacterized protein n=1 Tax=mine drainage metagenome TaxID=410659 RepID=E6Q5V6_9ZZZZ
MLALDTAAESTPSSSRGSLLGLTTSVTPSSRGTRRIEARPRCLLALDTAASQPTRADNLARPRYGCGVYPELVEGQPTRADNRYSG